MPIGLFDGASQDVCVRCGASMRLKFSDSYFFTLQMGCGKGTTTRREFLELWGLLYFAQTKHISNLQVVKDSKVIVDWVLQKGQLQVVLFDG